MIAEPRWTSTNESGEDWPGVLGDVGQPAPAGQVVEAVTGVGSLVRHQHESSAQPPALGQLAGPLRLGGPRLGSAARLYLDVVGCRPLDQSLLPLPLTVDHGLAVLLLLAALPQVDEGQDQRHEDDDQRPQQQGHHHSLRVGLLTHPGTGGGGGTGGAVLLLLLLLVLHTGPTGGQPGVQPGLVGQGGGRAHDGHAGLGDEQSALTTHTFTQHPGLQHRTK